MNSSDETLPNLCALKTNPWVDDDQKNPTCSLCGKNWILMIPTESSLVLNSQINIGSLLDAHHAGIWLNQSPILCQLHRISSF